MDYSDIYIDILKKRYARARMIPMLSWDVFALESRSIEGVSNGYESDRLYYDRTRLLALAKTNSWELPINIDQELSIPGNTIVVTNLQEQIQFASAGFFEMTGYHPYEAIGKRPVELLQGKDTEPEVKQQIRASINAREACQATLINYRKDGEPYYCQVRIMPVYTAGQELAAFIAVEREVAPDAA